MHAIITVVGRLQQHRLKKRTSLSASDGCSSSVRVMMPSHVLSAYERMPAQNDKSG